jgi:calcium-dependent protein kinase
MEPRLLDMMRKEVEMLCVLDHPHIVKIFEYAIDDSNEELVLVLEHLAGGDCQKLLTEALAVDTLLSEALVARLMHQVFLALSYCHSQGVLHRDIKPANMILTGEDLLGIADCKVIDFGVAVRDDSLERGIFGTLSHIAPEVAAQTGDIYTAKADVWAAGVTTFQLLTGLLPFGRPTMGAGGCRALLRPIAKYKGFDEDIAPKVQDVPGWENRSPEAQQFVRWLFEADPAKRPTCTEALEHPWLQMYKAETEKLSQEMIQSLARYPHAPPLVRCCLYAIAARQNIPDLERFGAAFLRIDREGKGKLSSDDLTAVLGRKSMPIPIKADHIIDAADLDHSGFINFTEFVAACLYTRHVQSGTLEELLGNAFNALDTDRDGKVCIAEIRELFRERDAPFLEHLPQDRPFDLKTWCSSLINSFAARPAQPEQKLRDYLRDIREQELAQPANQPGLAEQARKCIREQERVQPGLWPDGLNPTPSAARLAPMPGVGLVASPQRQASYTPPVVPAKVIANHDQASPQAQHLTVMAARGHSSVPTPGMLQFPQRQVPVASLKPAAPPPSASKSGGVTQGYLTPRIVPASPRGPLQATGPAPSSDANTPLPAHLLTGLQQGWVTCRQPLAMVQR